MKSVGKPTTTRIVPCLGMPPYSRRAVTGFMLSLLLCAPAFSAEFTRTISISRVAMISTVRPAGPGAQGVVRIYTLPIAAWGSSSCRTDAADISMDDWHMYGMIMRAWKDNVTLTITVESTERVDTTDTVCRITAVGSV